MTQVAFSHQFSTRWTNAPQKVKDALIQEFDDIVRLLDSETELETYEFSAPDLNAYIESIYADISQNKASEAPSIDSPLYKNDDNSLEDNAKNLKHKTLDPSSPYSKHNAADNEDVIAEDGMEYDANVSYDRHQLSTDSKIEVTTHIMEPINSDSRNIEHNESNDKDDGIIATDSDQAVFGDNTLENSFQGTFDEGFIKDLESRIDDYLSEQLATMSEDLKAWLREQINHHIDSQNHKHD